MADYPPLKWFAVDDFWRLELFIKDCSVYKGDFLSNILVIVSYMGLYIYVFLFAVAIYDSTLFHKVAWLGVVMTEILVSLSSPDSAQVLTSRTQCHSHAQGTPNRSTALCAFAVVYYSLFEVWMGSRSTVWFTVQCAWYFGLIFTTMMAQVLLQLYTVEEVLLGVVIGALSGVVMWALSLKVFIPHFKHPLMHKLRTAFMVKPHGFW